MNLNLAHGVRFLFFLFLFTATLNAYETVIESDEAYYDGELITLNGHVAIENAMGKVSAEKALLHKDEERVTKIDFPWIELKHNVSLTLADGGVLKCETLFLDYTEKTSLFVGNPQVIYRDEIGEVYADRARVDYIEIEGSLEVVKITLYDNVRLINLGSPERPALQYALADEVAYYPEEQVMVLEGKKARVLFHDKLRDMQLSARQVRAQRDPKTQKESVQGIGDVRFLFGPDELEKIKHRFQLK